MKVFAECNIVINPAMDAKSTRRIPGEVNMQIFSSQGVNAPKPIKLVIKGAGASLKTLSRVMGLMGEFHKTDEELAEKVRASILASEVDGMSTEEVAKLVRDNIVDELKEMEARDEDSLV